MSRRCPRCEHENLMEARYCDACGTDLDSPIGLEEQSSAISPRPGALRDAIPFLTGGVEQAKARFDGWKQKKTRDETDKAREQYFKEERDKGKDQQQAQKQESFRGTITRVMIGLLALAILIYIIVRNPKLPPWAAQQLTIQLLKEWNI